MSTFGGCIRMRYKMPLLGLAALERVLELDPKYPGARELKADVLKPRSQEILI